MPEGTDSSDSRQSTSTRFGGTMTIVAIALLLGVIAWRAFIYLALPEMIPVHWNAAGEADSFRDKSIGWVSLMVWYDLDAGPWLIAVSLLAGLPVLLILGLYMPRITAERKALDRPQDLSANPDHWVLGGIFYSNPDDPRTFVPKPPHTGFGRTFNLASSGGKLMVGLLVLLMVAPIVIMILDGSG